jgi:hypothetical protein
MIIPRPRPHDDVSLPLADEAGKRAAILQGGHEFAIMNIEHFGFNAQDLIGPLHLGRPALRQRPAGFGGVADIPVSGRDEFDFMAFGRP